MELETKPFGAILSDQAAAAQSAAAKRGLGSALLDFSVGSVYRALAEANAAVALWLQAMVLQVLTVTRATTSKGGDLDTWMADFGQTRSPPVPAIGAVTFSRFTPALPGFVPAGALVRTTDGTQTFAVLTDDELPTWNEALLGYDMAPGVASLTLPVTAVVAGEAGNVGANSVTLIASALPGVDTVNNAAAMIGGNDAESDAAFRLRFHAYMGSLARATPEAIRYAVEQVQAGLSFGLIENETPDGEYRAAYFSVIVDDGTGNPPPSLLSAVAASVENYRPVGVTFAVLGPEKVTAHVALTISTGSGVDHAEVVGIVADALTDFINELDLGEGLPFTRLAQIAYAASPLVGNVTAVLLNGGTADLLGAPRRVIRSGTIAVS